MKALFCALTAPVLFVSSIAMAGPAASPADGRWILDVSKSTFTRAAPKSAEVVLKHDGTSLSWSAKSVDAEGKAQEASGKDVFGEASPFPDGKGQRLITLVNATTVKRSFKYADGATLDDTCTVDGDTMTCAGSLVRDGETKPTKTIYTRAK